MRKILITGGAGFIGSNLTEKLIQKGNFVIVLDNFDPYYDPKLKDNNLNEVKNKRNFELIRGDIRKSRLVKNVINKYLPDIVVHLAAKVGVRKSIIAPRLYTEVNTIGTLNILESLKKNKTNNFIFASSSSVYGSNKKIPFSESDEVNNQLSPYAISKRSAEIFCKHYSELYKIPITIFRLFTVYGPRMRPDLAISKFITNIINQKTINIYGNGSMKRDFIYIDDVISGFIKAIDKPNKFEILNLGCSSPISIIDAISNIEKILNTKAYKNFLPVPKADMRITFADIKKANKLLRWKPNIIFRDGLLKTINYITKL